MRRYFIGGLIAAMLASAAWAQTSTTFCAKNNGGYVARIIMYWSPNETAVPPESSRRDLTLGTSVCQTVPVKGAFRLKIEALGAIASEVNVYDVTFRSGTFPLHGQNIQALGTIFDTQWSRYK